MEATRCTGAPCPALVAGSCGCAGPCPPARGRCPALLAWSPPAAPFHSPRCRGEAAAGACPRVTRITRAGGAGALTAGRGRGGAGSPAQREGGAAGRAALGGGGSAARGRPLGAGGPRPCPCRPPGPPRAAALCGAAPWSGPGGARPSPAFRVGSARRVPAAAAAAPRRSSAPGRSGVFSLP